MTTHELRTWPAPFTAILDGSKHHEVRKNDRNFKVGDILWLREWDPDSKADDQYTGRDLWAKVTYITVPGTWGMPPDICVMSIEVKVSSDQIPKDRTRSQSMAAVRLCDCGHTLTLHKGGEHCTFCECPSYRAKTT